MQGEKKIKFFEDCKAVKGHCRGVIIDLSRQSYKFVPNSLIDLLLQCDGCSIENMQKHYNNKYDTTIKEYVDFLIQNEFAFYTNTPALFPKLSIEWYSSSLVSNAIICDSKSYRNYGKISEELDRLNCKALQVRFFYPIEDEELLGILEMFGDSKIKDIEIVFPYSPARTNHNYQDFVKQNPRITAFFIYSSRYDGILFLDEARTLPLYHTTRNIADNSFCGVIHPNSFRINTTFFCESIQHNGCLNRKIAISSSGDIKNCPACSQSFGNIRDTTLEQALGHPDFKKYWSITKDQIGVCKDCEFRHMCTDCRVFIKDPEDMYSNPPSAPTTPT